MLLQNARLYTNLQGVVRLQPSISDVCKRWLTRTREVTHSSLKNHEGVINKCVSGKAYHPFRMVLSACLLSVSERLKLRILGLHLPVWYGYVSLMHGTARGKYDEEIKERYEQWWRDKGLLDLGLRSFDGPTVHSRIKNNSILWGFRSCAMFHG